MRSRMKEGTFQYKYSVLARSRHNDSGISSRLKALTFGTKIVFLNSYSTIFRIKANLNITRLGIEGVETISARAEWLLDARNHETRYEWITMYAQGITKMLLREGSTTSS
jgi:hypothetical protein